MAKSYQTLTGLEKASIFLMSIDEAAASEILSKMDSEEIKSITHSISSLGNIAPDIVDETIEEFLEEASSGTRIIGDVSQAQKLLSKAFGEDKVSSIMEKLNAPVGKSTWDKLNNVDENLLASFLRSEHPQTVALVLSKLKRSHVASILSIMTNDFAIEVMKRMLMIENVKPQVLDTLKKTLQQEFVSNISAKKQADSYEVMAEIFNNFDRQTESRFFELLEERDKESTERIRQLMFTFDDIVRIDGAGIQNIIRSVDKDKLIIALKGANDQIKELFFSNMSERAAKIMQEDMMALGPVRVKDVDEAQIAIIRITKELAEAGEITIPDGDESEEKMID